MLVKLGKTKTITKKLVKNKIQKKTNFFSFKINNKAIITPKSAFLEKVAKTK